MCGRLSAVLGDMVDEGASCGSPSGTAAAAWSDPGAFSAYNDQPAVSAIYHGLSGHNS